ncbi:AAA family ATPase [Bacteroides sp. 519]|uniref:AAA family ATPase n=1 Tax=Bacteroides sp. 519 TaxID=2302937 RepID=UPI0013D2451B|nr:AAA family ATPase [Bacteroides sp. 519]NDV60136.1 AAA family ATPase [Bacteroides sp. 519]
MKNKTTQIAKSLTQKPKGLFISDLKWKFLYYCVLYGKNTLITGPAGSGKTMTIRHLAKSFESTRQFFYINCGASQDPRSTFIGNTHYNQETGTFFSQSYFVKAIQIPDSIIMLDEISRAHPEAWNILMSVLDVNQRYLRLDEEVDSPTIRVADGVTFMATANIGNEYTSSRIMDKGLLDRFTHIEMELLGVEEEVRLLRQNYPDLPPDAVDIIAQIADKTRKELYSYNPRLSFAISTRQTQELAHLIQNGFSVQEAAEILIYPSYDPTGGNDSERTFIKQLVQKYF